MDVLNIAATIHQEVTSYINAQTDTRLLMIVNAVCRHMPQLNSDLLKQCPAFMAQGRFWEPVASVEGLDYIVNTILRQIAARNTRLDQIHHAVRQRVFFWCQCV